MDQRVLDAKISDNAPLTIQFLGQSSESKVGSGLVQDFWCRPPVVPGEVHNKKGPFCNAEAGVGLFASESLGPDLITICRQRPRAR